MTSEQSLRAIRRKIWDYDDTPQEAKAGRVLRYLKQRVLRERAKAPKAVGPYSGLTRNELRQTGLCETDFF